MVGIGVSPTSIIHQPSAIKNEKKEIIINHHRCFIPFYQEVREISFVPVLEQVVTVPP